MIAPSARATLTASRERAGSHALPERSRSRVGVANNQAAHRNIQADANATIHKLATCGSAEASVHSKDALSARNVHERAEHAESRRLRSCGSSRSRRRTAQRATKLILKLKPCLSNIKRKCYGLTAACCDAAQHPAFEQRAFCWFGRLRRRRCSHGGGTEKTERKRKKAQQTTLQEVDETRNEIKVATGRTRRELSFGDSVRE